MSCLTAGAAGSGQVAVDLGGLVDAIHVASTGVLGLRGVITRNAGPRDLRRLDTGARYRVDYFGAWPSITLDPGAQVGEYSQGQLSILTKGSGLSYCLSFSALSYTMAVGQSTRIRCGDARPVSGHDGSWAAVAAQARLLHHVSWDQLGQATSEHEPVLQVVTQNCTLYSYSERAWQQCALFRNYTASFLQRTAYSGRYSSNGQSQIYIGDKWVFKDDVTDLVTNRTGVQVLHRRPLPAAVPMSHAPRVCRSSACIHDRSSSETYEHRWQRCTDLHSQQVVEGVLI